MRLAGDADTKREVAFKTTKKVKDESSESKDLEEQLENLIKSIVLRLFTSWVSISGQRVGSALWGLVR